MKMCYFSTPTLVLCSCCFIFFLLFKSQKRLSFLRKEDIISTQLPPTFFSISQLTFTHFLYLFQRTCLYHFLRLKLPTYVILTLCFLKAQYMSIIAALSFIISASPKVLFVLPFTISLKILIAL